MKRKSGCLTVFIVIIVILGLIGGGGFFLIKTTKDIGVKWTEKDYESYRQKVNANSEAPGQFNLITVADGRFTSSGQINVERKFTSAEISSVLSKENGKYGPIKDVKVNFLGNNEGEATFVLTEGIFKFVRITEESVAKYPFLKNGLVNIPVYIKARVDKATPTSISADLQNISIGRIGLPSTLIEKVESEAVQVVNKMIKNYKTLSIEQLNFNKGEMYFKGNIPSELKTKP